MRTDPNPPFLHREPGSVGLTKGRALPRTGGIFVAQATMTMLGLRNPPLVPNGTRTSTSGSLAISASRLAAYYQ